MTYYDQKQNRFRIAIAVVMILGAVVFGVSTLLEWDLVYNITSPIVTFSASFLIFESLGQTGVYRRVAIWFMLGILVWFLGDVLWILEEYLAPENELLETLTDNLYLIPDYFYVAGLISYAAIRFRKNDFQLMMIETFVLSIIGFDTSQCAFENANPLYKVNFENLNTVLYYFVCVFTSILILLLLIKTGRQKHEKAFFVLGAALLLNDGLEIRYTALTLLGKESESIILDILYIVIMVIISLTISFSKLDQVSIDKDNWMDNRESRLRRNFSRIYWSNAIFLIVMAVILDLVGFFNAQDVFVFVIVSMAYVIMCKTLQTNILSEELLDQQKNENARLEQMVEEKTRELREMNAHLEKISNTDVLTGLFNRRYGIEYLETLVKDAENYPVALYSLDLNFFKPINDNYGHDMGDVVLKEVGHRLANLGQKRCTAIRVGGDEFLVIFRNASNIQAVENVGHLICDKMDEAIEAHVVTEEKGEQSHTFVISASIGVARYPQDTADLDNLMKLADQALYKIKHTHEKSAFLLYSEMQSFEEKQNVLSAMRKLKENGEDPDTEDADAEDEDSVWDDEDES